MRLSRAALRAFGMGTLTLATAACGSSSAGGNPSDSGSGMKDALDTGSTGDAIADVGSEQGCASCAAYGGPCFFSDAADCGDGATDSSGNADADAAPMGAYGGPPTDSGADSAPMGAYGGPPIDAGHP